LGANAIRKNLPTKTIFDVNSLLKQSIEYGLAHRDEALDYALSYGRGLDRAQGDRFVGMYVNDWTLDFGQRGREAVATLLARGYAAGAIPNLVVPEFVG
jgi:1,4-dihydroxy-6-naphthoate synthase